MYVVLFKARTRSDADLADYEQTFGRMLELVSARPGFVAIDGFAGEDGSELAVAVFDSLEAISEWRDEPEHVRTQEQGREEFFESYEITVADVVRKYRWDRTDGRVVADT